MFSKLIRRITPIAFSSTLFMLPEKSRKNDYSIVGNAPVLKRLQGEEWWISGIVSSQIGEPEEKLGPFFPNFLKLVSGTPEFILTPQGFKIRQHALYESLHQSNDLTNEQKLFGEFLIGLNRFQLSINLLHQFIVFLHQQGKFKNKPKTAVSVPTIFNLKQLWNYLAQISHQGQENIRCLVDERYHDQDITLFWGDAKDFFSAQPQAKLLAQHLVTMQYIPKDKRFLGWAQAIHWRGLGSDGRILQGIPELQSLLPHCLGYHNREQGGYNQRLKMFLAQLTQLREDSNRLLIALAATAGGRIKVYDVGSGPNFAAVACLEDCEITVSDMDPASLLSLSDAKQRKCIADVRYLDLCQLEVKPPADVRGKFDLVNSGLCLHQTDNQVKAIQYLTQLAKEDGFVVIQDVGQSGFYQALMAPGNLVDREGCLFDFKQINLSKLAVSKNTDTVHIAYPLSRFLASYPDTHLGIPMYCNQILYVVELPKACLAKLDELWSIKDYSACDAYLSKVTGKNINHLQDEITSRLSTSIGNINIYK